MSKVYVGVISPQGEHILRTFLDKYAPDAVVEPLGATGVKGKIKNYGKKADTLLIIIDDYNYNVCLPVAKDVLELPKVHCYTNDDDLKQFLLRRFGSIDTDIDTSSNNESFVISEPYSGVSNNSEELHSLREQLSQSEALVRNLTAQLEESNSDSDLSEFIKRIKDLESQLEEAKASQGSVDTEEIERLRTELSKSKDSISVIEGEKSRLEEKVSALTEELSSKAKSYEDSIIELDNLKELVASLEADKADDTLIKEQLDKLTDLESQLSTLKSQLTEKEVELNNIQVDLASTTEERNNYRDEVETLRGSMDSKLEVATEEKVGLQETIKSLTETVDELNAKNQGLEDELAEKTLQLEGALQGVAESEVLQADMESKASEIDELRNQIVGYKSQVEELQLEVSVKEGENSALAIQLESFKQTSSDSETTISDLNSRIAELEESLKNESERYSGLDTEVDVIRGEKAALDSLVASLNATISDYESQVAKLNGEIEILNSSLLELQSKQSDSELIEERRKVVRLEAELNALKAHGFGAKNTEEVDALKARIQELESDNTSKERIADLEADLAVAQEELNECRSNPMMILSGFNNPRAACSLRMSMPEKLNSKFAVIAGGSAESNTVIYQTLYNYCVNQKKRIVILDLVCDTDIDRAFAVRQVPSPIAWLSGSEPFTKFIAETKFNNIKVISTALAYYNDMCLIWVDWAKRLAELDGVADLVIINVGCLSNFISRVMFDSFVKIMKGIVVIKASPVNLRTSLINLSGITNLGNATAYCVDFDMKTSKELYQRLVKRCQSQILKDKEIINI